VFLTVAAPSEPVTEFMIAVNPTQDAEPIDADSGHWRRPWSDVVQGHWLEAVMQIAMSKPYVEAVCWQDLQDHTGIDLPMSGLIDGVGQPKNAFRRLLAFRHGLGLTGPGAGLQEDAAEGGDSTPAVVG